MLASWEFRVVSNYRNNLQLRAIRSRNLAQKSIQLLLDRSLPVNLTAIGSQEESEAAIDNESVTFTVDI